MRIRRVFVVALGALVPLSPVNAVSADDYPIEWSESLGLASLADVDAMLDAREEGAGWNMARDEPKTGHAEERRVETCNELLAAFDEGFVLNGHYDEGSEFAYNQAYCRFYSKLRTATSAKTSFVRDFKLDGSAPNSLPPHLEFDLLRADDEQHCKSMLERLMAAKQAGLSWAAFHRSLHDDYWRAANPERFAQMTADLHLVRATDAMSANYADRPGDPYSGVRLDLWARADFNHDGVEDLFVLVSSATIMILTRMSPDAVLSDAEPSESDDAALCDW